MSLSVCLYLLARYWREVVEGWKRGWRGGRVYRVTCRVYVRQSDDEPWQELSADYLKALVA